MQNTYIKIWEGIMMDMMEHGSAVALLDAAEDINTINAALRKIDADIGSLNSLKAYILVRKNELKLNGNFVE